MSSCRAARAFGSQHDLPLVVFSGRAIGLSQREYMCSDSFAAAHEIRPCTDKDASWATQGSGGRTGPDELLFMSKSNHSR